MQGLPEWPDPKQYPTWQEWAEKMISVLNEQLIDDYSEVGMQVSFAVALPPNGKWLPTTGGTFLNSSYPELAQKLGTTFTPAPPAGSTRLPTVTPGTGFVGGIKAI